MMGQTATFALLLIAAGSLSGERPSNDPVEAREGQWLHREVLGDGTLKATAVFLSWDYSTVIFTATCDQQTRELVLRHYLDPDWQSDKVPQIALSSSEQIVPLKTTRQGNMLEARTQLTPRLTALLKGQSHLEIDAPNKMNEPYYVGQARPLRKVALTCR